MIVDVPLIVIASGALLVCLVVILVFGNSLQAKRAPAASTPSSKTKQSPPTKKGKGGAKRPRPDQSSTEDKATGTPKPSAKKSKTSESQKSTASPAAPSSPVVAPAAATAATGGSNSEGKKKKRRKKAAPAASSASAATTIVKDEEEITEDDINFANSLASKAKNAPKAGSGEKEKEKELPKQKVVDTSEWATNDRRTKEITSLKSRLTQTEQERDELGKVVADNKKKLREASITNAKLATKLEELKESYEAKLKRYEAARANNEELPDEIDLKEKNYVQTGQETKIANLSKELGVQTQANLKMMKTIEALNATISRLEHERNTILTKGAKGISAKLQRELAEKSKALEFQLAENKKIREGLGLGNSSSDSSSSSSSSSSESSRALAERNEALEGDLQGKDEQLKELQMKLDDAQSELLRLKDQLGTTVGGVVEVGED